MRQLLSFLAHSISGLACLQCVDCTETSPGQLHLFVICHIVHEICLQPAEKKIYKLAHMRKMLDLQTTDKWAWNENVYENSLECAIMPWHEYMTPTPSWCWRQMSYAASTRVISHACIFLSSFFFLKHYIIKCTFYSLTLRVAASANKWWLRASTLLFAELWLSVQSHLEPLPKRGGRLYLWEERVKS